MLMHEQLIKRLKGLQHRIEGLWCHAARHRTLPHQPLIGFPPCYFSLISSFAIINVPELTGDGMPYTLVVENDQVTISPSVCVDVRWCHGSLLERVTNPSNFSKIIDHRPLLCLWVDGDQRLGTHAQNL